MFLLFSQIELFSQIDIYYLQIYTFLSEKNKLFLII